MTENAPKEDAKTLDYKININVSDIPEDMATFLINEAKTALARFTIDKDIAAYIKKAADEEFKTTWHVYVGRNFSSYVTHDKNRFIDFTIGQLSFEIFQCG